MVTVPCDVQCQDKIALSKVVRTHWLHPLKEIISDVHMTPRMMESFKCPLKTSL